MRDSTDGSGPQLRGPQLRGPQLWDPQLWDPQLWLVRHGESTWNVLGLAQGHDDQARLTRRGIQQARSVASELAGHPIGTLYASDLDRKSVV